MYPIYPNPFRFLSHIINDIYYCNIPLHCRECFYLYDCRGSWKEKRKCKNGCIELKVLEEQRRARDREDYLDALVKR